MLTLQIAAGIILAYVVIVHHKLLLKLAGTLGSLALVIAAVALLSWGASSAYTAISPQFWRFVSKLGMLLGSLMILGCVAAGGFGLLWALHEAFKRPNIHISKATVGIATIINCIIVVAASYAADLTPVGAWIVAADHWSRANGHADGVSVAIFAISCLWPFVVVVILRAARGRFVAACWLSGSEGA